MKNKVKQFVKSLGCTTAYSGHTKTMYIPEELHDKVLAKFGYGIPFTLGIK